MVNTNMNAIIPIDIQKQLENDYLSYAVKTLSRSLPSAIDGLKISQRRIMQVMLDGYGSSSKLSKVMKKV